MLDNSKKKAVLALYDDKILYVVLAQNNFGFYVDSYDSAELEEGVLKNGEVLKADFLKKILVNINRKIKINSIDLLLPHEYFLFDTHKLENEKKQNPKTLLKKYLKKERFNIDWAKTHDYETEIFERDSSVEYLFRALPKEIHESYDFIFKKSGMKINSINSDALAFLHFFKNESSASQIFFRKEQVHVLEYKNGVYSSHKKFKLSYEQLVQDIIKNVKTTKEEGESILRRYGVLRAHPDSQVLKRIERSLNPFFTYFGTRKMKKDHTLFVHFSDFPILGFVDRLKRRFSQNIQLLCPMKMDYNFHDVLSLHKKDSYQFESLIAQGLKDFSKK